MNEPDSEVILAQRYTYPTVALVIGVLSFVNLFGFEKSVLAMILGLKRSVGCRPLFFTPADPAQSRRSHSASCRSSWW
jgi:hypothetical protein